MIWFSVFWILSASWCNPREEASKRWRWFRFISSDLRYLASSEEKFIASFFKVHFSDNPKSIFCTLTARETSKFYYNKEKASRQTHTQEATKLAKGNSTEKHKWKRVECGHVKKKAKNQRSRFLQAYKNKNILNTWIWPCRPKHVVKDSEN
jgi:hypothetical protein